MRRSIGREPRKSVSANWPAPANAGTDHRQPNYKPWEGYETIGRRNNAIYSARASQLVISLVFSADGQFADLANGLVAAHRE
jgi:hypothetical protein